VANDNDSSFIHALAIAPRRGEGQDRAFALACEHGIVIAVADGAGGMSGGAQAAKAVVDAVAAVGSHAYDWTMLLAQLDHDQIGFGQTTAVVVWLTRDQLVGASAGDSAAWIIRGTEVEDVTRAQHRKPLIGDGAVITTLAAGPLAGGTLLVASDGLFRFAKREDIVRIAGGPDLAAAANQLVELVREPSGQVPDDVTVVLCREA